MENPRLLEERFDGVAVDKQIKDDLRLFRDVVLYFDLERAGYQHVMHGPVAPIGQDWNAMEFDGVEIYGAIDPCGLIIKINLRISQAPPLGRQGNYVPAVRGDGYFRVNYMTHSSAEPTIITPQTYNLETKARVFRLLDEGHNLVEEFGRLRK